MQIIVRRRMRAAWHRRIDRERKLERIQNTQILRACIAARIAFREIHALLRPWARNVSLCAPNQLLPGKLD